MQPHSRSNLSLPRSSAPSRQIRRARPWPALPVEARQQMARQLARLLRRLREEARHADERR
jgi:acyl-CoA reductase-like NAD-dependent aldehyde dehydrogenase